MQVHYTVDILFISTLYRCGSRKRGSQHKKKSMLTSNDNGFGHTGSHIKWPSRNEYTIGVTMYGLYLISAILCLFYNGSQLKFKV